MALPRAEPASTRRHARAYAYIDDLLPAVGALPDRWHRVVREPSPRDLDREPGRGQFLREDPNHRLQHLRCAAVAVGVEQHRDAALDDERAQGPLDPAVL